MTTSHSYCREVLRQFKNKALAKSMAGDGFPVELALAWLKESQKFMLPYDGKLYHDPFYKALDETKPLCLPYPVIALEYASHFGEDDSVAEIDMEGDPDTMLNAEIFKTVLLAKQTPTRIRIIPIYYSKLLHSGHWLPYDEVFLPRTGYFVREEMTADRYAIMLEHTNESRFKFESYEFESYERAMYVFLNFLNVLNCSNIVDSAPPRSKLQQLRGNPSTNFEYHTLTVAVPRTAAATGTGSPVESGRASPREHLRRGHIRHYPTHNVWINNMVVGANRGGGVVAKDYNMVPASMTPY